MNEKSTLEHTVVICIFGTIVALIWFSFAYSNNSIAAKFVENVRDWQTLIASIIATAAAGGTVWAIFKQIRETKRAEKNRINSEYMKERARLAQTLSDLIHHCALVVRSLKPYLEHFNRENINTAIPHGLSPNNSPDFSYAVEQRLVDFINASSAFGQHVRNSDKHQLIVTENAILLLTAMQLQASWMRSLNLPAENTSYTISEPVRIINICIELKNLADSMIRYARREIDDARPASDVLSSLGASHIFMGTEIPSHIEERIEENWKSEILGHQKNSIRSFPST